MLKLEAQSMQNAIAKARTLRPKVRIISADNRTYAVYGSRGDAYTVRFAVVNGHKLGECDCPARGLCYHIAAVAAVNIGIQSMKRQAAEKAAVPMNERQSLIQDITARWPKTWPPLAVELMSRFRRNKLEMLDDDMLRRVQLAIAM